MIDTVFTCANVTQDYHHRHRHHHDHYYYYYYHCCKIYRHQYIVVFIQDTILNIYELHTNPMNLKSVTLRPTKELIKFNKQLAKNASLREELDHLRQEKSVFDAIHSKLIKRLEATKRQINDYITQASHAYEER